MTCRAPTGSSRSGGERARRRAAPPPSTLPCAARELCELTFPRHGPALRRARSIIGQYMTPVEEACAGLFPPMVQKILIINVPRLFAPVWSVISYMLPEHHKERIVLLTTAKTSTEELKKARPLARPLPCCAGVAACGRPSHTRLARGSTCPRSTFPRTSKTEDEGGRRLSLARALSVMACRLCL